MTQPTTTHLAIDSTRLWDSLMELATIGAYDDAAAGLVGVNRQSLTDEDAAGRRRVIAWMKDAGLEVMVDEARHHLRAPGGTRTGSAAGHRRIAHRQRGHGRRVRRLPRSARCTGGRTVAQ